MAPRSQGFPVGRAYKAPATRSGNPGPPLLQALRQADAVTGASQYASGAKWSVTHPVDRLMGRGRAANQTMEVPWVAGRPWFHGSSRVFEKPDPAKADPLSLYGPGHYVTDDPTIASEYTGKGGGHLHGVQFVKRAQPLSKTKEWSEFFRRNPEMKPGVLHPLQTGHRLKERVGRERASYEKQGYNTGNVRRNPGDRNEVMFDFWHKEYGPNVTRYSFEPDEVFDIQAPITPADRSRLLDALANAQPAAPKLPGLKPELAEANRLKVAAQDVAARASDRVNSMNAVWHALEERLGPTRANEVIRAAGYDAIRYPGGVQTGGRPHNALVVLNDALLHRGGIPNPKYAGVPRPTHGG